MPEPAGTDGGIDLRRVPAQLRLIFENRLAAEVEIGGGNFPLPELVAVLLLAVRGNFLCIPGALRYDAPLARTGDAGLVAAPAHVRPADGNTGVWLQPAHRLVIAVPVVELFFPVRPFAARSVKPYAEDFSVAGQKLFELMHKIVVIRRSRAVQRVVAIPGREVNAEGQTGPAAGVGGLAHNVAPAVPERAGRDGMVCIPARPQAEAVVMLAGENHALHSRFADRLGPLIGVKAIRTEDRGRFRSVSPLPAGKGVYREMDKSVKFELLMAQLALRGHNPHQTLIQCSVHKEFLPCLLIVPDSAGSACHIACLGEHKDCHSP